MATVAQNRITRSVNPYSLFESAKALISSAISFNQGDLLYLDTTNHLIKPIALAADSATFLGIARVTISSGKLVSPYQGTAVDAAQAISDIPGPQAGVVAKLKLNSGDSFTSGCDVYPVAGDAQTVTVTGGVGISAIGVFQGAAVTAGAGSEGEVYLRAVK